MNKVKNFFYEDVEEEVEETRVEEPKKKFNPFKKESKVEEEPVVEVEEKQVDVKQEANNDLSERELFKAERTFNFPMDMGDDIFDNEEVEEKEETPVRREPVREQTYTRSIYHNISREEPKKEEPKKKFRPSPVISPVYGILDKNYTVEDVVDADKTKEFSLDKKIVDYDSVRNRAYKDIDEEFERTMNNDIFYNLDEEETNNEDELRNEEPSVIITYDDIDEDQPVEEAKEVEFKEVEVKAEIPEEETPVIVPKGSDDEEDDDIAPDVKIEPKKKTTKKVKETKKEDKEDLFNLIDNMYTEDEEEEE
jgi:hypothetical protein